MSVNNSKDDWRVSNTQLLTPTHRINTDWSNINCLLPPVYRRRATQDDKRRRKVSAVIKTENTPGGSSRQAISKGYTEKFGEFGAHKKGIDTKILLQNGGGPINSTTSSRRNS